MLISSFTRPSSEHPDHNDDLVLICQSANYAPVFVVIDGMGGQKHQSVDGSIVTGFHAAKMIRDSLYEMLNNLPVNISAATGGLAERLASEAMITANRRVYNLLNYADELPETMRVGAVGTVIIICEDGRRALCMQVGDTRAYAFSHGQLNQLSSDEDNILQAVHDGIINAEDAARISLLIDNYDGVQEPADETIVTINHTEYPISKAWRWFVHGNRPQNILPGNMVTNALGLRAINPYPQMTRRTVERGDTLLVCSDGFYKNLTSREIITTLQRADEPARDLGEVAFRRSQDRSNQRSTRDDITLIVVEF